MAQRPPKACRFPGCGALVYGGASRCQAHSASQDRAKTAERGYDGAWRKLAAWRLSVNPFCQIQVKCNGAIATCVDHIIPFRLREDLRLDDCNTQSACDACNNWKRGEDLKKDWSKVDLLPPPGPVLF